MVVSQQWPSPRFYYSSARFIAVMLKCLSSCGPVMGTSHVCLLNIVFRLISIVTLEHCFSYICSAKPANSDIQKRLVEVHYSGQGFKSAWFC